MGASDFYVDFQIEVADPGGILAAEAERRLRALREGHTDLVGAAVAIVELSNANTPHAYEVRVVVYTRPTYIAATEKGETSRQALKGALDALERQVRQKREKLR
ncbi:MAG: HPF/RaiA family ribosome-associated protein [Chloroflexota bacterium]